jgi:hypothetical protein
MGACVSSNNEEAEQKKKSQAIDKILEEDSRRLRKECKILLLGMRPGPSLFHCFPFPLSSGSRSALVADTLTQALARAESRPLSNK